MFINYNGFLSYQYHYEYIKEYFYIQDYNKNTISKILDTLNKNIDNVDIIESPISKKLTFRVSNKDFLLIDFENNNPSLLIFTLENNCSKCNQKI
jgi:hypothetical protein